MERTSPAGVKLAAPSKSNTGVIAPLARGFLVKGFTCTGELSGGISPPSL